MGVLLWISENWFELFQTAGIIGGLVLTAYTVGKDEKAREISNLIAIKQQHREIWRELYDRPKLFRVLQKDVDLNSQPISDEEELFVKSLFLHLDMVHRAKRAGLFVEIQGLHKDIREFVASPIPRVVWNRLKPFQDEEFIAFVEGDSK